VSEEERMVQRLKLAEAAIGLALSVWCLWSMIPEHRRLEWRMRCLLKAQDLTGMCARRTGVLSMEAELATGHENYTLAYGFSVARERLAVMYDQARGITP
jgi:hypothetical protein